MLSPEERKEIEAELPRYPHKQAVCIDAMKIVQKHRGWVSDESIRDIAQLLGMSHDDLDSVATFYNLIFRKPVGRHVILLCNSVSCWIMGYERLRQHLSERLGIQLAKPHRTRVLRCYRLSVLEPAITPPRLTIDNDLHRDLTPDSMERILENYR